MLETENQLTYHWVVQIWRFWLTHLLGWSENEVMKRAERWRTDILDDNSMFYHEGPEYWIADLFVPKEIRKAYPPWIAVRVSWSIYPVLEKYRERFGFSMEHLNEVRDQLKTQIAKSLDEHLKQVLP